jgi:DNA-directed RNA polymerase specialized sigma24 family protein
MMSSPRTSSQSRKDPKVGIAPLASSDRHGKPYKRYSDVEEEISRVLSTDVSTWSATGLKSETIVHLIRKLRACGEIEVLGRLVDMLGRRISRIATGCAQGFDQTTTEEIVLQVGVEVIELVLAKTSSRQSEFLEIAFRQAVKRRTLNHVEKRSHHPRPHQFVARRADVDESSGNPSDPINALENDAPGPEEIVLEAEQIRAGLAAITNPHHRKAIVLHYLQGWPITDKDPEKQTLCTHFRVTDRQIRTWMNTALSQMRDALGETL